MEPHEKIPVHEDKLWKRRAESLAWHGAWFLRVLLLQLQDPVFRVADSPVSRKSQPFNSYGLSDLENYS